MCNANHECIMYEGKRVLSELLELNDKGELVSVDNHFTIEWCIDRHHTRIADNMIVKLVFVEEGFHRFSCALIYKKSECGKYHPAAYVPIRAWLVRRKYRQIIETLTNK